MINDWIRHERKRPWPVLRHDTAVLGGIEENYDKFCLRADIILIDLDISVQNIEW